MKIVVLGGGVSTERNVAQVTATSVCQALRRRGHQAVYVDLFLGMENYDKPLEEAFSEPDGLCGKVEIRTEAPDLCAVWKSRKKQSVSRLGKNVIEICSLADCVFVGLHGKAAAADLQRAALLSRDRTRDSAAGDRNDRAAAGRDVARQRAAGERHVAAGHSLESFIGADCQR